MVVGRTQGNPLESPTYPKWHSGIGWTVGCLEDTRESIGQSYLSYMGQWDRMDSRI